MGFPLGHLKCSGASDKRTLSSYLFIIVLEILAISIRSNESVEGITADGEEIKLQPFADDLTAFLRNDTSLGNFLSLVDDFRGCSGLKINFDKTETMLLGNQAFLRSEDINFRNIHVKKQLKS